MEKNKKLYPLRFIPIPSKKVWGGNSLTTRFDKHFTECDEEGNEHPLTAADLVGESWEIADMGFKDSVVDGGWLSGNTISEVMETYLERVVGEHVFQYYGRQFPLLIKFLDVQDKLSVQVHPDDEIAEQRYDSLGKKEIWYIMDAEPGAKIYLGFNKEMTAQELYDRCSNGTVEEVLNVIYPKKGDSYLINPGTVHSAGKGLLIAEIQESSDLTFRLYDWGREFDPSTARDMHLAEAMDFIDYGKFDPSLSLHREKEGTLAECPEFIVTKIRLHDPLQITAGSDSSFVIYVCIEGEASVQVPSTDSEGKKKTDNYLLKKGQTLLVPAETTEFFLIPTDRDTVLLEATAGKLDFTDDYINPDTEAFLEGEDYEGLQDDDDEN